MSVAKLWHSYAIASAWPSAVITALNLLFLAQLGICPKDRPECCKQSKRLTQSAESGPELPFIERWSRSKAVERAVGLEQTPVRSADMQKSSEI
jgi:hypothetical protein